MGMAAEQPITFCHVKMQKFETMETLTAVVHKEEDMYVAECPEAGTVSQGNTIDEAVANLKEATELYLEEFPLKEKKRTWMTTFEVAMSARA